MFEANQRMSDNPLRECPSCGQDELRRVINSVGVVFKGPGFYVTDSRKGGSNGSGSSTSGSKSRESKSEKKADTSTAAAE
jgi:putative FmdB family regulatory protein